MFVSSIFALVHLAALTAMAAPAPAEILGPESFPTQANVSDIEELLRRGQYPNEVLFFSHCYGGADQGTLMAYYRNGPGYPNGKIPDAWAVIDDGSQVPWEGKTYTGTFSGMGAGTKATSKISSKAGSMSRKALAGTASNSWGQAFNCYKDTDTWLYNCYNSPIMNGHKTDCYSEYWCYDICELIDDINDLKNICLVDRLFFASARARLHRHLVVLPRESNDRSIAAPSPGWRIDASRFAAISSSDAARQVEHLSVVLEEAPHIPSVFAGRAKPVAADLQDEHRVWWFLSDFRRKAFQQVVKEVQTRDQDLPLDLTMMKNIRSVHICHPHPESGWDYAEYLQHCVAIALTWLDNFRHFSAELKYFAFVTGRPHVLEVTAHFAASKHSILEDIGRNVKRDAAKILWPFFVHKPGIRLCISGSLAKLLSDEPVNLAALEFSKTQQYPGVTLWLDAPLERRVLEPVWQECAVVELMLDEVTIDADSLAMLLGKELGVRCIVLNAVTLCGGHWQQVLEAVLENPRLFWCTIDRGRYAGISKVQLYESDLPNPYRDSPIRRTSSLFTPYQGDILALERVNERLHLAWRQ